MLKGKLCKVVERNSSTELFKCKVGKIWGTYVI